MFFKKVNDIIFELTNRCNLGCIMCDIWAEKNKKDFSLKLYEEIISSKMLSNAKCVALTGGEPFTIPNFDDYYSIARKHLPKTHINISTNGYFTDKIMQFLNDASPINTSITISYDGFEVHDSIRRNQNSSKKLLNTASQIRSNFPDIEISLKMTIMPQNHDRILETAEQSNAMGIPFQIKMIEELENYTNRINSLPVNSMFTNDEKLKIHSQLNDAIAKNLIKNKNNAIDILNKCKSCNSVTCHWPTTTVFVGIDGNVYLCRKKHPVGNLSYGSFEELINSKQREIVKKSMIKCADITCISYSSN